MPGVFRHFLKPGIGSLSLVHPSGIRTRPGIVSSAHRMRRKGREMYFDQVEFGKRIRELRRIHRKSQEALASDLNVSSDHIKKIEMGIRACSIDLLVELSTYFDVSTDFLLTGKDYESIRAKKRLEAVLGELTDIVREMA